MSLPGGRSDHSHLLLTAQHSVSKGEQEGHTLPGRIASRPQLEAGLKGEVQTACGSAPGHLPDVGLWSTPSPILPKDQNYLPHVPNTANM